MTRWEFEWKCRGCGNGGTGNVRAHTPMHLVCRAAVAAHGSLAPYCTSTRSIDINDKSGGGKLLIHIGAAGAAAGVAS